MTAPVLDVQDLRVTFRTDHGLVRAVDGVSFVVHEGETLGLVGESGSGKSMTNLAVMGLVPSPPGLVTATHVRLLGRDLLGLPPRELRRVRGAEVAMVFQDPLTSLNPLLPIGVQLTEVLVAHGRARGREARRRAAAGLADVGIPEPERRLRQYPHELSGGMRQRVMIAMALLCEPELLLADEPTTALDVTVQAQILELLRALQRRRGTAIVLVTHDLGVVAGTADRVHVMYAGRLVETAPTRELFRAPAHPYTRGLLASVPRIGGQGGAARGPAAAGVARVAPEPLRPRLAAIPGQPPDLASPPVGCAFSPRCAHAVERCRLAPPVLRDFAPDHAAACPVHPTSGGAP